MNDTAGTTGLVSLVRTLWTSPGILFHSIRERPPWKPVLIILLLLVIVRAVLVLGPLVDFILETATAGNSRGADPEMMEKFVQHPWFQAGFVLVLLPLRFLAGLAAFSGLVLLLLNISGGTDRPDRFRTIFAVTVWAKLVLIPYSAVWVILVLARGTPEVYFGPALLLERSSGFLFVFLRTLDLFEIWFLAVAVIGVRTLFDVSSLRAWMVTLPPWLILGLLGLG